MARRGPAPRCSSHMARATARVAVAFRSKRHLSIKLVEAVRILRSFPTELKRGPVIKGRPRSGCVRPDKLSPFDPSGDLFSI